MTLYRTLVDEELTSHMGRFVSLPPNVDEPTKYMIPGPITQDICCVRLLHLDVGSHATIAFGVERWYETKTEGGNKARDCFFQIYILVNATSDNMGYLFSLPQEFDSFDDMVEVINGL